MTYSGAVPPSAVLHGAQPLPFKRLLARHREATELLSILAAAPFLLFPSRYTLVGAGLIAAGWIVRRLTTGRWSVPTPAHWPMRVMLLAVLLSLVPSIRLDYSAPKFWGLVLGLATLYATVNAFRTPASLRRAAAGLLCVGVLLALVGLLGMSDPADKGLIPHPAFALPRIFGSIQSSTGVTAGIPPNELGGILTLFVPVAGSLVLSRGWTRYFALPAFFLLSGVVLLTESRAAVAGVALALIAGLVLLGRKRVGMRAVLAIASGVGAGAFVLGRNSLSQYLSSDAAADLAANLSGRIELWQRALTMIVDMPFTGIGLNTFPIILRTFYPTVHHEGWAILPHAHNLFLQTALDLGVFGLAAFVMIAVLAIRGGLAAVRLPEHRYLAAGLLLGLLAHGAYSLVDAVALGSKPSSALWGILGLLIALGATARERVPTQVRRLGTRPRIPRMWVVRARVVGVPLLVLALTAPAALNAARLVLHGSGASVDVAFLDADIAIASSVAWGPYPGRVWAARALAAETRGDQPAELTALSKGFDAAPWDASVGLRLGDLRWAGLDRDGAVEAWRAAGASEILTERGRASPTIATALEWFDLAQAVDPKDWQPFAVAGGRLLDSQNVERAAPLIAQALSLRGSQVAREAVADRMRHPDQPVLTDPVITPHSSIDAQLFGQAARVFALRDDRDGAFFAARLAVRADPSSLTLWPQMATIWQAQGRSDLAQQAREQAVSANP